MATRCSVFFIQLLVLFPDEPPLKPWVLRGGVAKYKTKKILHFVNHFNKSASYKLEL